MKFVYPWMLALLALVPVMGAVWLWLRARTEKRLDGFVAPALQGRLMPRSPGLFRVQAALVLAGLLLVVFAAARYCSGSREHRQFLPSHLRSRRPALSKSLSDSSLSV